MNQVLEAAPWVEAADGHRWQLQARIPPTPRASLLFLPGMGIAARHFMGFADALAARGVAVFVHDWRGIGSSSRRAGRTVDWGYRELLTLDLPAAQAVVAAQVPGVPRTLGGHSLGGQLAACRAGLAQDSADALWLVASGVPDWRTFPVRTRWWLPPAYRLLRWTSESLGKLPGRRIGFGGEESRGVMRDWTRCGLTGRYSMDGDDLEGALETVRVPIRAVAMAADWLAPVSSLRGLLRKCPAAPARIAVLDAVGPGVPADHYRWMKQPDGTVAALLD